MARYIDADKYVEYLEKEICSKCIDEVCGACGLDSARWIAEEFPTEDVVPKSEVKKIFEKLKERECSNSVCAWCVHASAYGRRNEECDKPYIDKNGKEQKACYVYAKFESLIDNELAELKKKYTGGKYEN